MLEEETGHLVRSAQGGNPGAVEALFTLYLPRVRQIVALRLGYCAVDASTLDDLVQDALLRVFENLGQYEESSEGLFRNWLATCVGNSVRNSLRSARALKRGGGRVRTFSESGLDELADALFPSRGPTASAILRGKETLARLESSLLALAERERELIVLRRLCETSYSELADLLRFESEVAARQAFHRAMARLKRTSGLDDSTGPVSARST